MGASPMKIYAHRGQHGDPPENSRDAVLAAYNSQADGLEVDLQRLKDGQIVFHHDRVIKTTAGGQVDYHDLANLRFEEVSERLDHEPITLEEALKEKPTDITLVLECKPHRSNIGFCRTLLRHLRNHPPNNIVLSSESWTLLRQLSMKASYPLAPVVRWTKGVHRTYLGRSFFSEVHLRWNLALQEEIRSIFTRRNIPIIAWTVNDRDDFDRLKQLGIDGVMTDNESWYV